MIIRALLLYIACSISLAPLQAMEQLSAKALLDQVIALNRIQEPELDEQSLRKRITELSAACRSKMTDAASPRQKIAILNTVLLQDRRVSYLSNLYWRDASLTAAALRGRCNCLAGTVLYVVIGRQLGLPIHMVLVPGHAFARWEQGQGENRERINIETTAGGRETTDERYLQRSAISHPQDLALFKLNRSLKDHEFLAELKRIAADHLRSANKIQQAEDLMKAVCEVFPERDDYALQLLDIQVARSKDRVSYRRAVQSLLQKTRSPGVRTSCLMVLASEMAALKRYEGQRRYLLLAFKEAPKTSMRAVLMNLATCHRSLKDWRGARRFMELAVALIDRNDPSLAGALYNLAIMQKNDSDLKAALASIDQALRINPESWNLQVIKAGYLVLHGQREQGLQLFATVKKPRVDASFWNNMQAWFYSVSQQRDKFYQAFEYCLQHSNSPRTLIWINQDVDLDVYRSEQRFKDLLTKHRQRIMGKTGN